MHYAETFQPASALLPFSLLILFYSLDRVAYEPQDKIIVHLHLENNSAVDVLGCTIKVCNYV